MYCAYCGEKIVEDAKFCHSCGKPVSETIRKAEETKDSTGEITDGELTGSPLPKNEEAGEERRGSAEKENVPLGNFSNDFLPEKRIEGKDDSRLSPRSSGDQGDAKRMYVENEEEAIAIFIEKNQAYYLKKWGFHEERPKKMSWNWAAFFFTVSWAAYRRMYGLVLVGFLTILALQFFGILFRHPAFPIVGALALSVAFGAFGNRFYYGKMKEVLEKSRHQNGQYSKFRLSEDGGVGELGMIFTMIGVVFFFLASLFTGFLTMTQEIEFGYGEKDGFIIGRSDTFLPEEEIFYAFDFPNYTGGKYEVVIEKMGEPPVLYNSWEDEVSSEWPGLISRMYAPVEPGEYRMKVIVDGEIAAEGTFYIELEWDFEGGNLNEF